MMKPVGGRGKKAPYETVGVRIPVPIKDQVEKLAESYRKGVLEVGAQTESTEELEDYLQCSILVNRFIEQRNLTDKVADPKRYIRANYLADFVQWLQKQIDAL
jgi:hypothetical protein